MHSCTYALMHALWLINMHSLIHAHKYSHAEAHTYIRLHTNTHWHTCMYVHTMHKYIHWQIYMHSRTHKLSHAIKLHTYKQINFNVSLSIKKSISVRHWYYKKLLIHFNLIYLTIVDVNNLNTANSWIFILTQIKFEILFWYI